MKSKYTIIFDWGGVIAPDDSINAANVLSKKYDVMYEEVLDILMDEEDCSFDSNYEPFLNRVIDFSGASASEIMELKNSSQATEVLDYCHDLANNGFTLYLLSDQMQFRTDYIKSNNDLSCFKETYFSSDIGFTKSDIRPFEYVLSQNNLKAEECLFIDDNPNNIQNAKNVGIDGLQFKNLVELKEYLNQKLS